MAITLTTRLSAGFAGSPSTDVTSASFTPSANSKLYVVVFGVANGGSVDIVHTSNTGGLTFTRLIQSASSGGGNGGKIAIFEADVGASPSAMTVTFDLDSGGAGSAYPWVGAFDATGNGVQVKSGQIVSSAVDGAGGSAVGITSGTLPAAATSGNTSVLVVGRNNDANGAATVPSGWTALFNPVDSYISGVSFHRSDFTGTSATVTDVGESVFAVGSVLFELEEAGPPTPVEFVSQGAAVAGTTSITTAAYGAGWAAGDLGVCVVASNHATTEATEPTVAGFTKIGTLNGGGGTQGAGVGNRRLTFFTRELQAGDDTTPAIDLATGNVMIAAISIFRKPAAYTWSAAVAAFGAETTAGTSWSEAMTTNPVLDAGDVAILACAVRDTSTSSAEGITATGATFGTPAEQIDSASETGNDISLHVWTANVLTGPSSAAPTCTATHSTSETGVMGVLRIRSSSSGLTSVTATRATTWNVKAPVTATRATTWDVRTAATATRATTWDVLTPATSTRSTTWRVLSGPTATRATTWDVRTPATATRATTWDVLSATTATRSTTWRVGAAVTSTRATTWRVPAAVTGTRATTWNVDGTLGTVTATRATTWHVRAAVATTRATTWDVRTAATSSRTTTWDTRAATTATRAASWDTLAAVSRALATSWDVRTAVTAQRSTTWNVASSLLSVTSSRATSWRTAARVTGSRAASWDTRAVVTEARGTTWDVRTTTTRQASTTWRVLTPPAATRSTSWRTLERVLATRATSWNVESDALPMRLVVGTPETVRRYTAGTPEPGTVAVGDAHPSRYTVGGPT